MMGWRGVLAWMALVVALVPQSMAQDRNDLDPPQPEQSAFRLLSVAEWNAELKKLNLSDLPQALLGRKRAELAASCRIVREGTIVVLDLRAGRMDVRSLRFADDITPFTFTAAEDLVGLTEWKVGDAVSWLDRPVFRADGTVDFVREVTKLSDLMHYKPPAVEPASLTEAAKKQLVEKKRSKSGRIYGDSSEFKMWLILYANSLDAAAELERSTHSPIGWRSTWLLYCVTGFWQKTWRFPAHVSAVEEDGIVVAFDELRPYYQDWQGPAVRFDIGSKSDDGYLRRHVAVPARVLERIAERDEVVVTLEVEGDGFWSLKQMKGAAGLFPIRYALLDESDAGVAGDPPNKPEKPPTEPPARPPRPEPPPPKGAVLTVDRIGALVAEIQALDITTVEKVEKFRALDARGYQIAVRGVVDDVVPVMVPGKVWIDTRPGYGRWVDGQVETVRVDLSGIFPPDRWGGGASGTRSFTIPSVERDKVKRWRKEDVVSWRERVRVADDGRFACVPIYERFSDLKYEGPKSSRR